MFRGDTAADGENAWERQTQAFSELYDHFWNSNFMSALSEDEQNVKNKLYDNYFIYARHEAGQHLDDYLFYADMTLDEHLSIYQNLMERMGYDSSSQDAVEFKNALEESRETARELATVQKRILKNKNTEQISVGNRPAKIDKSRNMSQGINKFFNTTINISRAIGVLSEKVLVQNGIDKFLGYSASLANFKYGIRGWKSLRLSDNLTEHEN